MSFQEIDPPQDDSSERFSIFGPSVAVELAKATQAAKGTVAGMLGNPPDSPDPPKPCEADTETVESKGKRRTPDPASQEPEGDGSEKPVNLQRWAIGVEADRWWVFQWFSNHKEWRERGRLDLPRGRVRGLARLLAEHGGTISKDQAVDLFRTDGKQTWGRKKVYDSVCVPARRDLVKAIRGAVSRVSKQKVQGDPIPWDQSAQAWQAAIEIGYSVKDHDGKLNFKTRDQLDSTDLADL